MARKSKGKPPAAVDPPFHGHKVTILDNAGKPAAVMNLRPHRRDSNGRIHLDAPPHGTTVNQTEGFHSVLLRLYEIEDGMGTHPVATARLLGECRAICERFLPETLVRVLRSKHG